MVTAIIAAAGQGKRMNASGVNKVFIPLLNTPILCYSVQTFVSCPDVDRLVVVAAPEEVSQLESLLQGMNLPKPWSIVAGGSERQYSIGNALRAIAQETGIIVVHDGARPLTGVVLVTTVIDAARQFRAAIAAVPVKDTIKTVDETGFAIGTPERSRLWAIQTPQAFETVLLRQAHFQAAQDGFLGTDDAVLVERLGVPVKIILGSYQNIKITTPEDLIVARALLGAFDDNECPTAKDGGQNSMERMGIGYDVHRLVEGRKLILGGVEIPYTQGLEGHSDADVLLHAIKDAMLGAAGLGDIGRHFPDSDVKYKGISSLVLLSEVRDLLAEQSWQVNNVDTVIVAEKPKLAPFIELMNCTVATALGIETNRVNIKATTTEGLGFAGRCEGIAAQAVVSLVRTKEYCVDKR